MRTHSKQWKRSSFPSRRGSRFEHFAPGTASTCAYKCVYTKMYVCLYVRTYLQLKRLRLRDASERWRKGDLSWVLSLGHDVDNPRHHGLSKLDLGRGRVGVGGVFCLFFLEGKEGKCVE